MQLPRVESLPLLVTKWAAILNPLLAKPTNNASIIKNVVLVSGNNKIPHLLGRTQQGWWLVDVNGVANIYRNQPLNAEYLYLSSSAAVTVSLGVF